MRRVALASVLAVAVAGAGTVPGAVASELESAQEGAVAVQRLHDALDEAVTSGDVPAMRWTLDQLTPLLAGMESGERYAVEDGDRALSAEALSVNQQADALLSEQRADLPPFPVPLNMLLQRLLEILADLIDNLLGGGVPPAARTAIS